ncbi:MAG: DUF465 domain-containing protein [Rhodobacteraceae bacterium]|nr:DUF465 domain-containing protein [Paracoccaceae bacterium]
MSHTPHELSEDFPDAGQVIHDLRQSDAHFGKLAEQYHDLNRAVHRAETRVDAISPEAEIELRKQRAALKDEIARMISAAQST